MEMKIKKVNDMPVQSKEVFTQYTQPLIEDMVKGVSIEAIQSKIFEEVNSSRDHKAHFELMINSLASIIPKWIQKNSQHLNKYITLVNSVLHTLEQFDKSAWGVYMKSLNSLYKWTIPSFKN